MKYDINRFIKKHELYYDQAFYELEKGHKRSHWMWYIFPQLKGLGHSSFSEYYGLDGIDEAREYYNNEYLKNHLLEICKILLKTDDDIENIFGYPDYMKLNSCMTLFELVDSNEVLFKKIIEKFYLGKRDINTIKLIK